MTKATTCLRMIPLRAEPSHRSEMVSQILFGEELEVLESEHDFTKVRMVETSYEGWAQSTQLVSWQGHDGSGGSRVGLSDVYAVCGKVRSKLLHSTAIPTRRMPMGGEVYHIEGELREPTLTDFDSEFGRLVEYYLQSPYMWGGRSIYGIDCSGFSQACYAHFGISLKRDAYQQADMGTIVDFLTEIQPGDLAFFDNEQGRITHVGIMIDNQTIVHASGQVQIDPLDHEGIFNKDEKRYTHKLRIIKRYF